MNTIIWFLSNTLKKNEVLYVYRYISDLFHCSEVCL